MVRIVKSLFILGLSCCFSGQAPAQRPDLGLNGAVTWIDDTHIRVEYDWSEQAQLSDWIMTSGSSLVRGDGSVTVTGGSSGVRAMIWKQGIRCSRIIANNAAPLTSAGHLNFYSNLITFTGNWLPDPGRGAVLITSDNFWTHDGVKGEDMGAPLLVVGVTRNYEYTLSTAGMTMKSSADNVVYSDNIACTPELDRKIALGGYGGETKWGKIIIEGEITMPWQYEPVPPDVINIQSSGAVFAPVIEVTGNPLIEWTFDDSSTSNSPAPVKDYGSAGSRHNYLKVTPWSALIGINIGYDASDGGYGDFDIIPQQNVLGFQNLELAGEGLEYLCASYNPITELDLRGLTSLKFIELFKCQYLSKLKMGSHPVLERFCVENCSVDSLDLSGCTGLEDIRAALNNYTFINWGSVGQSVWHICIRDNPQMTQKLPPLTQFPVLRELWDWNTNQTGVFECHSPVMQSILSYDNNYSGADVSGCTDLRVLSLSGSQLASLELGTANRLINVQLKDCGLTRSQVDYVLQTLDAAGNGSGRLELTGNAVPSVGSLVFYNNLIAKGWTVDMILPVAVSEINIFTSGGETSIKTRNGTLLLQVDVAPSDATDKSVTWSVAGYTGEAIINESGLLTAVSDGTVIVTAVANDGSGVSGTIIITIANQTDPLNDCSASVGKIITTVNEIQVLVNNCYTFWKAELFSLNGLLLRREYITGNLLVFDVSALLPGIYLIMLTQGENVRTARVVVP